MFYKMQLLAFNINGSLVSSGDTIPLGEFDTTPVILVLDKINRFKSDLGSMNLACGLLPTTIETNGYRVIIMVLDEYLNPVTYAQMYEYKLN